MNTHKPQEHLAIASKLYRITENMKKVDYILRYSSLTLTVIEKAASVANLNEFHNFGHQLGAAEAGIKIALEEHMDKETVSEIALVLLFHDASHQGVMQWYDEIKALEAMDTVLGPKNISLVTKKSYRDFMQTMRDHIFSSIFSTRGTRTSITAQIIQDADLAHLGQGPVYWLWSSMGLVDEFNRRSTKRISPVDFIQKEQPLFVASLAQAGNGSVFLTKGARSIFSDPLVDVDHVAKFNIRQIEFAYGVRKRNITLEEFGKQLTILQ